MLFNKKRAAVNIAGLGGQIEGMHYTHAPDNKSLALVLHPHSKYGGSMNNKIVIALSEAFIALGFDVLRINFRGVGKSAGEFDNGVGEINDALSAIDWMCNKDPNMKLDNAWVAGFGFGGIIALQAVMRRPEITGFISVNPPIEDISAISTLTPCPNGLFIASERDHHASPANVQKLSTSVACQKNASVSYQCIKDADHYFSNHLQEMQDMAHNYVGQCINNRTDQSTHYQPLYDQYLRKTNAMKLAKEKMGIEEN